MTMELSPFLERPSARLPELGRERFIEADRIARRYIDGRLDRIGLKKERVTMQDEYPDEPQPELDFLEAEMEHETANNLYTAELAYLDREARKAGKTVMDLTPEERAQLFETFPRKEALDEAERSAIQAYGRAAAASWNISAREGGTLADRLDAELAQIDLDIRRACRVPNDAERNARLEALELQAEQLYLQIPSLGKKAEHLVAALIRRRAREHGKEHVVTASMPTMLEDMHDKIDVRVALGDKVIDLQLKVLALYNDYMLESRTLKAAEGQRKISGKPVSLIAIDEDQVKDAIRFEQMGADRADRKVRSRGMQGEMAILNHIGLQLPEFAKGAFQEIIERSGREREPSSERGAPVSERRPKSRLKKTDIQRTPSRVLELIGLMPSGARSAADFQHARNSLLQELDALKSAGIVKEDLIEPKDAFDPRIARIREALGLGAADEREERHAA